MVDNTQYRRVKTATSVQLVRLGGLRLWPLALLVLLLSSGFLADYADAAKRPRPLRIGALTTSWGPTPQIVGVRDGLLELGYREDEDFVIGVRFTSGDLHILPTAARNLVRHGVDLILATGEHTVRAAQQATTTIPIVFTNMEDPVGSGLVKSFARPGGNITGVATLNLKLGPKRLQVFHEIIPALQRVLYPYDASDVYAQTAVQEYREAARLLGITLVERAVRTEAEAQAVLARAQQDGVDGMLAPRCCALNLPGFILEAASQQAIPAMFNDVFWVERGALAGYGPNFYASGRQAARLVDKIFKGAHPAYLPVEVNSQIEFAINLKTAKDLGLSISPEVLYQASKLVR